MSEIITTARSARETLAKGLSALQASPNSPSSFQQAAEPIAAAMGALHRIERSGGADISAAAPQALDAVRQALAILQSQATSDPRVMPVLEMVAGSLGMVFSLTKAAKYGPAPQPVAQAVAPVVQPFQQQRPAQVAPAFAPQAQQPFAPPQQPAPFAPPQQPYAPAPQPYAQPQQQPYAQPQQQPYAQPQQKPYAQPQQPAPFAPQQQPAPYAQPPQPVQQPAPAHQPAPWAPATMASAPQQPAQQQPQQPQRQPQPQQQQAMQQQSRGAPVPSQRPPTPDDIKNEKFPQVEAELGTHSVSNFYKGLSGNDVVDHGGLFISTYNIPAIGQNLKVHVALPGGYEFEALGVVRWTREARESMSSDISPPGFGLQFTKISQDARNLVHRYVRNREPMFHDDL
jgi:hypothetical protein